MTPFFPQIPSSPGPLPARKRILLVDDHPIVHEGLRALFARTPDLVLSGAFLSPADAQASIQSQPPDLILMDISMDTTNGLLATRQFVAAFPDLPILIFTCNDETIYAPMAREAGAKGLVMKDQPGHEILRAIRTVLQGLPYQSPHLVQHHHGTSSLSSPRSTFGSKREMTPKENEILAYLAQGYSTARMALALNLSLKTIETHCQHIRSKLNIDHQSDLMRWAVCHQAKGLAALPEHSSRM